MLYGQGGDLGLHLQRHLVMESDNALVRLRARAGPNRRRWPPPWRRTTLLMTRLSLLEPAALAAYAGGGGLPLFQNTGADFASEYRRRLSQVSTTGFGVFAHYHMFTLGEGTRLLPVKNLTPNALPS